MNELKAVLSSDSDRQAVKTMDNESDIFEYLYLHYGTCLIVSTKMLQNLESCHSPSPHDLESSLVKIIVTIDFETKKRQYSLVNPEKISHIVSNCLDESIRIDWAKRIINL